MTVISFCLEEALAYGDHAAQVLYLIRGWIRHNHANGTHRINGRTWTYNSVRAWSDILPHLTPKQVRTALDTLVEDGVLLKDYHNQSKMNRTLWYAFADESFLPHSEEAGHIHLPTEAAAQANPPAQMGKCSKYSNNTILEEDISLTRTREEVSERASQKEETEPSLSEDALPPVSGSEGAGSAVGELPARGEGLPGPAPKPRPRANPVAQGGNPAQEDNPWDPLQHPPTLEQVIEIGQVDGVSEERCELFLANFESKGWLISDGVYVQNWRQRLKLWKPGNEPEFARRRPPGEGASPRSPIKPEQGKPEKREYSFHEQEERNWLEKIRKSGGMAYGINGEKFKLVGDELIPILEEPVSV